MKYFCYHMFIKNAISGHVSKFHEMCIALFSYLSKDWIQTEQSLF